MMLLEYIDLCKSTRNLLLFHNRTLYNFCRTVTVKFMKCFPTSALPSFAEGLKLGNVRHVIDAVESIYPIASIGPVPQKCFS